MTAGALIQFLQKYPAETRILVEGQDLGYDDARPVPEFRAVRVLDYQPSVLGKYEDADVPVSPPLFDALIIERDR